MEKMNSGEYRNDLAKEIKAIRENGDNHTAQSFLKQAKKTDEYQDAEHEHRQEATKDSLSKVRREEMMKRFPKIISLLGDIHSHKEGRSHHNEEGEIDKKYLIISLLSESGLGSMIMDAEKILGQEEINDLIWKTPFKTRSVLEMSDFVATLQACREYGLITTDKDIYDTFIKFYNESARNWLDHGRITFLVSALSLFPNIFTSDSLKKQIEEMTEKHKQRNFTTWKGGDHKEIADKEFDRSYDELIQAISKPNSN